MRGVPGQRRRVALGGAQDDVGPHRSQERLHASWLDAGDQGVLVDPHAATFDRRRQPAGESRRMDRGAMRRVGPAQDIGGPYQRRRLSSPEQREIVPAESPHSRPSATYARARLELRLRPRGDDRAALREVAVDPLEFGDPMDLVDRAAHLAPCSASAGSRPYRRATAGSDAENSAEHQPPLRPDAPNPATACSSTTMRRLGSAAAR